MKVTSKRETRQKIEEKINMGSKIIKGGANLSGHVKDGRYSLNVPKCTMPDPKPTLLVKKVLP